MSRKTKKPTHVWYEMKGLQFLFKDGFLVFSFQPQGALWEGLINVVWRTYKFVPRLLQKCLGQYGDQPRGWRAILSHSVPTVSTGDIAFFFPLLRDHCVVEINPLSTHLWNPHLSFFSTCFLPHIAPTFNTTTDFITAWWDSKCFKATTCIWSRRSGHKKKKTRRSWRLIFTNKKSKACSTWKLHVWKLINSVSRPVNKKQL